MATLLPNGKQFFAGAGGLPLTGGKVYTYAAGTDTPKATYATSLGDVANTNPVILDARGEAAIFWTGAYKVVLRDALDNLIYTIDNVQAGTGNTYLTLDALKAADTTTGSAILSAPGIGGTFLWVAGNFTGLADDATIVASSNTPITSGAWVKQTTEVVTTAAVVPGLGDNTAALQALLNAAAGRAILIVNRAVPYTVSASLKRANGTNVFLEAGATLKWIGPDPTVNTGIFDDSGVDGGSIRVKGQGEAYFTAAKPGLPLYCVTANNFGNTRTTNVTYADLRGINVQHVIVSVDRTYAAVVTPAAAQAAGTTTNCCENITVLRGGANNDTPYSGFASCFIRYTFGGLIDGPTYTNVSDGVFLWGGNAALDVDGMPQNERKCGGFVVENVKVVGTSVGGGVVGSMAANSRYLNSTVIRAGDVGFDLEGCVDMTAEGCWAEDCGNANFSIFFASGRCALVDCTSKHKTGGANLFQTYNVTQAPFGGDISILGGYWSGNQVNGDLPGLIKASGAMRSLTIKGIKGDRAAIVADGNNNNVVTISDNTLGYSKYTNAVFNPIYVSKVHVFSDAFGATFGTTIITGNKIQTFADQVLGTIPIAVVIGDNNGTPFLTITDNHTRGPWHNADIAVTYDGTNVGTAAQIEVSDNVLQDSTNAGTATISFTNAGAGTPVFMRRRNRNLSGIALDPAASTGWQPDTGISKLTANATYAGTAAATYTQADEQSLRDEVRDLSQTVKALKDALFASNDIGA